MSGQRNSYYDHPSGQGSSAADAYNTPGTASRDTFRTPGTGTGMYDSRPTHSNGYAMANDEDDEDDEDEDWNVYDDFNMNRPVSGALHRDSMGGQEGYWDSAAPGTSARDAKPEAVQTPYTDYPQRKSLLSSDAFGFDVRNSDPRKSLPPTSNAIGAAGMAPDGVHEAEAQRAQRLSMLSGPGSKNADSATGIELITVPALGTEFTNEELKGMARKTKKKKKRAAKKKRIGMWVHGEDHLWGWLSPRIAVFVAFIFLVALGITLYFVIPRVPSFAFLTTNPVTAVPDGSAMKVNHSPTNFSMTMDLNLRADNMNGWVPSKINGLKVTVTDQTSAVKVGEGKLESISFPGRKKTIFKVSVDFSHQSLNVTGDQTFLDFYQACGPKYPSSPRPTLSLGVLLSWKVSGLMGTKRDYATISDLECPFTLQNYQ